MQLNKIYDLYLQSGGVVSTDSRKAKGIFFALKGDNFDANLFAESALDNGAKYAVVDNKEVVKDDRYILVDDTLDTLQKLANFHRRQLSIPVLAVTGTNGKTTTKELIREVLKKKYKVVATEGNFNNHIGVPLTLLSIGSDAQVAVVETGANHPGEIKFLCSIVEPTYGLITNVGIAHLEGFGSEEGIRKTKGELYDFLEKTGGMAFYNADDSILSSMINERKGINSKPYHIEAEPLTSPDGLLHFKLGDNKYSTHFVGEINIKNITAAIEIGKYFGVDTDEALDAVKEYIPSNNRSQIIKSSSNTIVMDAYNANPSSMLLAIENFQKFPAENKCMILGQMNELGPKSKELHSQVINAALQIVSKDNLFLVGNNFKELLPERTFCQVTDLVETIKKSPIKCKSILVKGSRGNKLETLKDYLLY